MKTYLLRSEQWVAQRPDEVFAFFAEAANLGAITPPWLKFRIVTPTPIKMAIGTRIAYKIGWHILRLQWLTEIIEWDPPRRFTDVQLRGPYAFWRHSHSFVPEDSGTRIIDLVRYRLPLGHLGAIAHHFKVRRDLEAIFDYRAERIREILEGDSSRDHPQLAAAASRNASAKNPHLSEERLLRQDSSRIAYSPNVRLRRRMWW